MASSDMSQMDILIQARNAALVEASKYPQLMEHILPLVTQSPTLELRRWVAGFVAEALASPNLDQNQKQQMSLPLLDTLQAFLEYPHADTPTLKSTIQACASLYPLIFRHVIDNPNDEATWNRMLAVKSIILRNFDTYPPGVRICCVKFIQMIVQTETHGVIADPRRSDQNEISLALVPSNHPFLVTSDLEAESSGLLDRILGVLQDKTSDVLLVTAVINCMGALIKTRASIATKILNNVMRFNPLEYATQPLTTKSTLIIRSLERTIRALFFNTQRRTPNHPLGPRMQTYLDRLQQGRNMLLQDASRKRRATATSEDAPDSAKKPRLEGPPSSSPQLGPVSVSQIFTLSNDPSSSFNVVDIPQDVVSRLLIPLLRKVDQPRLATAIQAVKGRLTALAKAQAQARAEAQAQTQQFVEDDEEYEPDFQPMEDAEQLKNRLDMESSDDLGIGIPKVSQIHLGAFKMDPPRQLSQNDLHSFTNSMIDSLFSKLDVSAAAPATSETKPGLNRLAATTGDRNAIVTTLTRLITRPTAGMELEAPKNDLNNRGRFRLLQYILSDWTHRMELATSWLTEEWYNDQICKKAFESESKSSNPPQPNFSIWASKFLNELNAFIGSEHEKLLIRFVSDVPGLNVEILNRVKHLANDPERVTMVVRVIHYLTLFRPPIRDICLDALEDLYKNYDGAKQPATGVLKKFRPQVLEQTVA